MPGNHVTIDSQKGSWNSCIAREPFRARHCTSMVGDEDTLGYLPRPANVRVAAEPALSERAMVNRRQGETR
jgi:hypothetical protein